MVETLIEPWFIFALIWSVGATCDGDGRKKFSEYLRKKMDDEKVIPKENLLTLQFFIVLTHSMALRSVICDPLLI